MDSVSIEQIIDVSAAKPLSESRVRNAKKASFKGKPCVFFKDMQCRAPMCDMEICEKCPEGGFICNKINFMKRMVQKVLLVILSFLLLSEF